MKALMKRYSPPGMPVKGDTVTVCVCMIFSVLWSAVSFLEEYFWDRSFLFSTVGDPGGFYMIRYMTEFHSLTAGKFYPFAVTATVILLFIPFRYAYFFRGSKSVYLIKRLPEKAPLAKRVLVIPLAELLLCGATAFGILLICYAVYMLATPAECLPPDQWKLLWRSLLCLN